MVRAFIRALGPNGRVVGNTFNVELVYTPRKLAKRVKAYIDLERVVERLSGAYAGSSQQREAT